MGLRQCLQAVAWTRKINRGPGFTFHAWGSGSCLETALIWRSASLVEGWVFAHGDGGETGPWSRTDLPNQPKTTMKWLSVTRRLGWEDSPQWTALEFETASAVMIHLKINWWPVKQRLDILYGFTGLYVAGLFEGRWKLPYRTVLCYGHQIFLI